MSKPVFILNGPNLNLLGKRQPEIYGTTSLDDIERDAGALAAELGLSIDFRQSNHEGELVDWLQQARTDALAVILNAAAFTHSSIAIRDAVLALTIPVIEVHISNIHAREEFRRHSYLADVVSGSIVGLGPNGYLLALRAVKACAGR